MTKEISNIINAIKHDIDAMCKTNDMYELTCLRADIIDNINKLAHKKRECIEADDPAHGLWIPVSERLPKENETVIASTDYGVYPEARYSKEYGWEWAYEAGSDYWVKREGVIAWMPLPEPYKAESEE